MNANEVVVHIEQRDGVHVVVELLRKRVCQAGESTDVHPHGEVLTFDMRRAYMGRVRAADNRLCLATSAHGRAVTLLGLRVGAIATNVHASPASGFFAAIFGVTFLRLARDKRPNFVNLDACAGTLRTVRSRYAAHAPPTSANRRRIVPLATPVRREVERTEQPSTSAEITATRLAVLNLFMVNPSYYTALACQAECDGFARKH